MRIIFILITFILILLTLEVNKSHAKSMEAYWNSLGGLSNISNPRYIEGQKAGHLSLGSIQARSKIETAQIASIRTPSFRAGCGGIDFYAGGFSFINSDQLVSLMKSIGSNAQDPLLQLAIDNMCPKCGSIIKKFEDVVRKVNAMNINSCEAAQGLIKTAGSGLQTAKNYACKTYGLNSGKFEDASAANAACTSGGQATSTASAAGDEFPAGDINIAWKSLRDSGLLDFDTLEGIKLAELLMTLSGTIILIDAKDDNSEPLIIPYYSKIEEDTTLTALLEGGSFAGMFCMDKDKCLTIGEGLQITITEEEAYLNRVSRAMSEIATAIEADDESLLKDEAYKLLSFSSLPIYNILRIHNSYFKDTIEAKGIGEFLALDILYGYLQRVNQTVRRAAAKYDNESYRLVFKQWFEDQREIKKALDAKKAGLSSKFNDYLKLIERTSKVQEMLDKTTQGRIKF